MATATSVEISTIKPAGGGDYTTLATWWAAKRSGGGSANVAAWAECYGGGDMGTVLLSANGYTPTDDYRTRILSATGERHDGTGGGAYLTATNTNGIEARHDLVQMEGLRFVLSGAAAETRGVYMSNYENLELDSCLFDIQDATQSTYALRVNMPLGTKVIGTVRNCLVYGNSKTNARGFLFLCSSGAATVEISNCSVSNAAAGFWFFEQSSTLTVTSTNNIAAGCTTCFKQSGTPNVTQTYCMASDTTATTWGGAGNVNGEAAGDIFENPASDLSLKAGSPAIEAGANLYGSITTDAVGSDRRPAAAWDMGALTTAAASYNLYRGVGGIANVDFSAAVGTVLSGTSTKIFTGLVHAANTRYTYVLRPFRTLSDDSVLVTPDMSCRVEFETDGSGDWLGNRPGSVEGISAEIISGGVIRLRWNYRTPYGGPQGTPNDFGIYYSTDPDITPGSPQATESYTADGAYVKDISLADGVAYYFAITARDETPVESYISEIIGPYIADDTAPSAPTLIAAATF